MSQITVTCLLFSDEYYTDNRYVNIGDSVILHIFKFLNKKTPWTKLKAATI